jgi:hypothetical protein
MKKYLFPFIAVSALAGGVLMACLHHNSNGNLLNANIEALIQTEYDTRPCAWGYGVCEYVDIIDGEIVTWDTEGVFIEPSN